MNKMIDFNNKSKKDDYPKMKDSSEDCPAQNMLKVVAGKWKPEIFKMASNGPLRFGKLLNSLEGVSRQSLTMALRELEESGLFTRNIISEKPKHVEYTLSEKGQELLPFFEQLEKMK